MSGQQLYAQLGPLWAFMLVCLCECAAVTLVERTDAESGLSPLWPFKFML